MKSQFVRNAHRLATVLRNQGYTSRSQILAAFDRKGKGAIGVVGIGAVLSKELVHLLDAEAYGPGEWAELMPGIVWDVAESDKPDIGLDGERVDPSGAEV